MTSPLVPPRRSIGVDQGELKWHTGLIPTPLRPYTGHQDARRAGGRNRRRDPVRADVEYGDLRRHLYADDGKLRHFVNVYVNDDDIRYWIANDALSRDTTASSHRGRRFAGVGTAAPRS